jgi:putative tryptophan/tyrosine transport system substrate-binding protein
MRVQTNRRRFIAGLGSAAVSLPRAASSQAGRLRRIGVLAGAAEDDPEMQARLAAFRQELQRLGWGEDHNVRIDYRFAPGGVRTQELASELISLRPDVVVAQATANAAALQKETSEIPIVFLNVSDPVGSGFVASLARPGANMTGLLLYEEGIIGKCVAMLQEVAPRITRVALIANPKTTPYNYFIRAARTIAPSLALDTIPTPVETSAEIEHSVDSFARVPNGGLLVLPDVMTNANRDLIIALAARYELPAAYFGRFFVAAGGLMSYGVDFVDVFRLAASYVDRILNGAKPADLPVQAPIKYQTVLNLKTANALGLVFPTTLIARADEVIE